ncbi:MAG: type II toxin-antitoxin system HicA family toxin [Alphaproteobacteria bacterium]|jgi:predicted RNA binding protein YcfA (HicA-like mRNA interferase family)|nr:type II toxin-antitoxin system HicA family toxin [Alphaproteobacteria bacterium]MDP6270769.1 type II toxin-antitoxin system HicA family toxin [Alphaproteobacteria bacterium]
MADFAPKLRKMLRDAGCSAVGRGRGKGSHEFWHEPNSGKRFAVPQKIKSRHTANEILRQAGLAKAF